MAIKLPPAPSGTPPGSSFWNDWYEKLRTLINSGTISQLWTSIDFTGSNITDLVTRAHNNLQSFQGGTAGEYYHLTSAQHAKVSVATSGTYTPTLTNTTNIAASTTYVAQYLRVGSVVTVSGRVDVDPTALGSVVLEMTLPIASNFAAIQQCAGVAADPSVSGQSAAIYAEVTNDKAVMAWITTDITNQAMYYTYTYQVI